MIPEKYRFRVPAGLRLRHPVHLLALGGGLGAAPAAPGTVGTLAALPLFAVLLQIPPAWYASATALGLIFGVAICERAANDAGVHDHPAIVWDEVVGFLVAGLPVALGLTWGHWALDWAAIFVLFRAFDVVKPWPISWLDRRLEGGIGIMLDDILAGVFAALVYAAVAAQFGPLVGGPRF